MFLFKRGNYYHFEYYDEIAKRKKRISTGCKSKNEATKFVSQYFIREKSKDAYHPLTLLKFIDEYNRYSEKTFSFKYIKSIKVTFKLFQEYIGNPFISEIKHRDAERYILFVHQRAKYSASLYLRTLKAAFNKAIQWNYLNNNPFNGIKLRRGETNIPKIISPNELELILSSTFNSTLKEMFFTAYYSGLRQSELVNLKWDSVDFHRKTIVVSNSDEFTTKNKKERVIPMNKLTYSQLSQLMQNAKSEYVFPNKNQYKFHPDNVSHKFKQAVRKGNLSERFHFHSLRHSFASNLVRKGVSLYIVKELLGHENISTTQIYAHLNNDSLVKAVDLLCE